MLTISTTHKSYTIEIGEGVLPQADFFEDFSKVFILIDETVERFHGVRVKALYQGDQFHFLTIKSGEASKSFSNFECLANKILELGLDRKSTLVALGGGVVGDLTGFLASSLMRGVGYIQMPTTLLSQVDSSVGGKTAINVAQGKNLVGSFYQPDHVFIDLSFLKTLNQRTLKCGYAEIVKYGFIIDDAFFQWLDQAGTNSLLSISDEYFDSDKIEKAVRRSCEIKAEIVSQDEKEKGIRALLNFGHTFGHAFEALFHYDGTIEHGEAVLLGMAMAARYSNVIGMLSNDALQTIKTHYKAYNLPWLWSDHFGKGVKFDADSFLKTMYKDKKVDTGKLVLILLKDIGQAYIEKNVDNAQLLAFLKEEFK